MIINDIIFCDDIRQEISNKNTLVGTYNDKLVITPHGREIIWPIPIRLSIYLKATRESNDPLLKNFKFELLDVEKDMLATIVGDLNPAMEQDRPMIFLMSGIIPFKRTGALFGRLSLESSEGAENVVLNMDLKFSVEIAPTSNL